eukprot:CAMPEP_0184332532 /NCGR_PEP_ID=MMETSP1089-20130417/1691_1 /TAXON_ID=38269 ORGANISM="Gloeochaete wittrockiana, Strain SAG46.84" /NCGR_SAMPLE_ID=MMETSP1089 /ASSEMBLY_ACC=CAM_ASM_000445 /LENGTH=584 /DNA_ID=CAMNT_0026655941 /DNA_START=62 /DNA_END=1816 /DNA_ORIENTATION=-
MAEIQDDSLQPVQLLLEELRNEDQQIRLNSIRRIGTIATALGEEQTRAHLLPFLKDCCDDEEEVVFALAEELGNFTSFVGGADFAHSLIDILEFLSSSDENPVREKAVSSFVSVGSALPQANFSEFFIPSIQRLASSQFPSSKLSFPQLAVFAYPKANAAEREQLRTSYFALFDCESNPVRKEASLHFGKFIKVIEDELIMNDAFPIFVRSCNDPQDNVRINAVESAVALASRFSNADTVKHILPIFKSFATDKSWRVRYMVANLISKIAQAFGPEILLSEVVATFATLLRDPEPEVRTVSAKNVTDFCKLLPDDTLVVSDIIPCVKDLATDSSQQVRSSLASVIMGLAPILGRENTLKYLLDIFLILLKDDFPEVRLNIISKLDDVNKLIGIELLSQSLLPAIVELALDRQWRVRLAIIEYIPLLAKQLGSEFFDDKLSNLCMGWLGDTVFSIREAATATVKSIIELFGPEWAGTSIIPKILNLHTHHNYLYRMTTLFAIITLAPVVGPANISNTILPVVIKMASDSVPNIRFNVAKTFHALAKYADPAIIDSRFRPTLNKLLEDNDPDVKYFADQALQSLTV